MKLTIRCGWISLFAFSTCFFVPTKARSEQTAAEEPKQANVAQELQNPVADLISIPVQANINMGLGPEDKNQLLVNIQPVIPVPLTKQVNVITRTIVPLLSNPSTALPGGDRINGIGDVVLSLFLAPSKASGLMWGVGPVQLLPTATHELLGGGKYGIGPTGVVLLVTGPWTLGVLANHIWSVTGDEARGEVNATFIQPIASFTLPSGLNLGVTSETTRNWEAPEGTESWTVPVQASVSQLVTVGELPINLSFGGRYTIEGPTGAPEWGLRLQSTLVLPTKSSK